ncbi:MAG: DUF4351 domain-containing protein [Chloroflexaceae bacterium]|nr:DUF4351 domain-containing protein [Chloroflexaceae bacterium]
MEGKAEGKAEGKIELLQRGLELRFGSVPSDLVQQLERLNSEQLDALIAAMMQAPTQESFATQLPNGHTASNGAISP